MKKLNSKSILFTFLALACLVTGCGKSEPDSSNSGSSSTASSAKVSYTYEFEDGCTTGRHSFNSLDEYCKGLRQQEANNYCAYDTRATYFRNNGCPGSFELLL